MFIAYVSSPFVTDNAGNTIKKWWLARSNAPSTSNPALFTTVTQVMLMTDGYSILFWNNGGTYLPLLSGVGAGTA